MIIQFPIAIQEYYLNELETPKATSGKLLQFPKAHEPESDYHSLIDWFDC